jgi:hypothetical protein
MPPVFTRRRAVVSLALQCAACFWSYAATSKALKRLGILSLGSPQDEDEVAFQRTFLEALARVGLTVGIFRSFEPILEQSERPSD